MNEKLTALLAQATWCPDLTVVPFYDHSSESDPRFDQLVFKCTVVDDCDFYIVAASPVRIDSDDDVEATFQDWNHPEANDIWIYAHWDDYLGSRDPILLSHMIKYGDLPVVHDSTFEPKLSKDVL